MSAVEHLGQKPDLSTDELDFSPDGMDIDFRNRILDLWQRAIEETIESIPDGELAANRHLYDDQDLSGHPKTAVTVGPGFVRLQTMAPLEQSMGGLDTIHSKLVAIRDALPPDLQPSQCLFGEELFMIQLAVARYRANSQLAVPVNK